ncbi:MAG: hypothetical protein B6U68_01830 [Candidatus Aenigmarchaeota archaeon ex4484_14]|nr:MAG: hypothetical protein B6U68_01830 [Candidatus Aenigmarchaeota archaeon ex4484_14]
MFDEKTKHGMLVGAFVGVAVLSLLIPIFLSLGLTRFTSLFLYYSIPVTGVITGYILSGQSSRKKTFSWLLSGNDTNNVNNLFTSYDREDDRKEPEHELIGKNVAIKTTDGERLHGKLKTSGSHFLYLEDLTDRTKHFFIDKERVKEIMPA